MKTCIFGGTFDPPHIGHLLIAQTIIESENFDRLIFLPAYLSPVKQGREMSPPEKRIKMLDMALLNNDNMLSMLVAMFEEKEKKSVRNDRHHVNLHE